jgi:hypothetical protein
MKKVLLLALFGAFSASISAQTGTETIDFSTSTGDKGSFTVTQIRGTQNSGTVTSVGGAGTGGATVTITGVATVNPTVNVALSAIPNTSLANSSVTVAGTTIALGGTGAINFTGLTGSATLAQLPTGIPNTNLANSSVTVAGTTIALGGTGAINFTGLTGSATLAQLPTGIPNTNLANSSITIDGQATSLGGTYVAGSNTATATGTESLAAKLVRCNPGATDITRTLPPTPTDGYLITYKRINATAGNTIIVPNTGQTLSEGTQVKLITVGRTVCFQYNLASTQWVVID